MDTRVAVISLIVSEEGRQQGSAEQINALLHKFAQYIVGRMGLPYKTKQVNIICVAVDAPLDAISALSGKLGSLPGVNVKTTYAPVAKT